MKPKVHSIAGRSIIARKPVQTSQSSDMDVDTMSVDEAEAEIPSYTPENKKLRPQMLRYSSDIDAILSSSPQAQSTPRLRLEPSFMNNGRTTLRHVPAESRSMFDLYSDSEHGMASQSSELGMDVRPSGTIFTDDSLKRKPTVSAIAGGVKRYKKHPSPNRDDLDSLATKVQYLPLEEPTPTTEGARFILSGKSTNGNIQSGKRSSTIQGKMGFEKREFPKTFGSMPIIGGKGPKSAARKSASLRYSAQKPHDDGSEMDTDELQWDYTEYNIGAGRY